MKLNMSDTYHSDEDCEINEKQHSKLLAAVSQLDDKQRIKPPSRKEPSFQISEFHLVKGLSEKNVEINSLATFLQKQPKFSKIGKELSSFQQKVKTLEAPLEKPIADKVHRSVGFGKVKEQLGRWDAVVESNRVSEQLKFPLDCSVVRFETNNDFIANIKSLPRNDLEAQMDEILNNSPTVQEERKEEEEYRLTLAELRERRKEMARLRARESYMMAKLIKRNKIKSKSYRRLVRRDRMKQQEKDFEMLKKTDPEACLKQLEQLERVRAEERATLRHRNTGQWARNKATRAKYDKECRQELAQQLAISRDLTQKVNAQDSSDEEEKESIPQSHNTDNPWIASKTTSEVEEFVSGYRKFWEERNKKEHGGNESSQQGKTEKQKIKNMKSFESNHAGQENAKITGGKDKFPEKKNKNSENENLNNTEQHNSEDNRLLVTAESSHTSEFGNKNHKVPVVPNKAVKKRRKKKKKDVKQSPLIEQKNAVTTRVEDKFSKKKNRNVENENLNNTEQLNPENNRLLVTAESSRTSESGNKNQKLSANLNEAVEKQTKKKKRKGAKQTPLIATSDSWNVTSLKLSEERCVKSKKSKTKSNTNSTSQKDLTGSSSKSKIANMDKVLKKNSKRKLMKRKAINVEESIGKDDIESSSDDDDDDDEPSLKLKKTSTRPEIDELLEETSSGINRNRSSEMNLNDLVRQANLIVESASDDEKPSLKLNKTSKRPEIDEVLLEETSSEINRNRSSEMNLNDLVKHANLDVNEPQVSSENIDPDKFIKMKPKHLMTVLPDLITGGDEALDDNEEEDDEDETDERQKVITEAFAEDDVVAAFRKEKEEETEKSKPKDVDLTLPGWGEWGGKNLPVKRKRRRFIAKFPEAPVRKDSKKGDVIILEERNKKFKSHQVNQLPFPFRSVKDFEASIRAPLGDTFIPEIAHKKLTRPEVVTKLGTVIKPMDEEILVRKKPLTGVP